MSALWQLVRQEKLDPIFLITWWEEITVPHDTALNFVASLAVDRRIPRFCIKIPECRLSNQIIFGNISSCDLDKKSSLTAADSFNHPARLALRRSGGRGVVFRF